MTADIRAFYRETAAGATPYTIGAVVEAVGRDADAVEADLAALESSGFLRSTHLADGPQVWWRRAAGLEIESGTKRDRNEPETIRRRLTLFENVQELASVGAWEYDLEREEGWGTAEVARIHGHSPPTDIQPEDSIQAYHPADRGTIREAFQTAIEDHEPYDLELRLVGGNAETRWVRTRGQVEVEDGTAVRVYGTIQDITARKRQQRARRRRERAVRQLQTATANLLEARTETDIADQVVQFLDRHHTLAPVAVLLYDDGTGSLQPAATSTAVETDHHGRAKPVDPGPGALWSAFESGDPRRIEATDLPASLEGIDLDRGSVVALPVGDFGVLVATTDEVDGTDDTQVLEVLAANAEAALRRLRHLSETAAVASDLEAYESKVEELERLLATIQRLQERVAGATSRAAVEAAVCEELLELERTAFCWIGHPQTADADLSAGASAGVDGGLLDRLGSASDPTLPAERAAERRTSTSIQSIAQELPGNAWAKVALAAGFESVVSIPVEYDGVLYAVLTVYAGTEAGFGDMHERLFADVASLLATYNGMLGERFTDESARTVDLEFELADSAYLLEHLAVTAEATVRFRTVIETDADTVSLLLRVTAGSVEAVRAAAADMARVRSVAAFGDSDSRQLTLTVERPFLATAVVEHGARLVDSVADGESTRIRVQLPATASSRPLVEVLVSRFADIELVSKGASSADDTAGPVRPGTLLTDRQFEILRAAYFGGYYESPRRTTAADVAAEFDISQPVVYEHMQGAHRRILREVLEGAGIQGR